jgi:hypothetical protein
MKKLIIFGVIGMLLIVGLGIYFYSSSQDVPTLREGFGDVLKQGLSTFASAITFITPNADASSNLTNISFEPDNSSHIATFNNDLVFYLNFDPNLSSTDTYDYTNYSADGLFNDNAHYTTDGYLGGGLFLDGFDDRTNHSSQEHLKIPGNITLMGWVNWSSITQPGSDLVGAIIVGYGDDNDEGDNNVIYSCGLTKFKNIVMFWESGGGTNHGGDSSVTYSANANEWHHYACVRTWTGSTNNMDFYFDGVKLGTTQTSATQPNNYDTDTELAVGALHGQTTSDKYSINGTVDEVRIYNSSLNASDMLAIYEGSYQTFYNTGEQKILNQDLSSGNPGWANITLDGFQTLQSTKLAWKFDDGTIENFTNGNVTDYSLSGVNDLNNVNGTLVFISNENNSYSPFNYGNITIETFGMGAAMDLEYPIFSNYYDNNFTTAGEFVRINVTIESTNGTVLLDFGGTNYTATNLTSNMYLGQWNR